MSLQSEVYLRESDHFYFNRKTGKQLISWSKFSSLFYPQFDKAKMAPLCAGKGDYIGMTEQQVLDQWENHGTETAGHGTVVHKALENYSNTFTVLPEHKELERLVKSVQAEYSEYYKVLSEESVFCKYGIAGQLDKYLQVSSHKNSSFDLQDFKNFKNGLEFVPKEKSREKWMKYPIEHLPNCNYTKVALQNSFYAMCVQEITGRKPRKLSVKYIPLEDKMKHETVVMPYLLRDVQCMITEYLRMLSAGEIQPLTAKPMEEMAL